MYGYLGTYLVKDFMTNIGETDGRKDVLTKLWEKVNGKIM